MYYFTARVTYQGIASIIEIELLVININVLKVPVPRFFR